MLFFGWKSIIEGPITKMTHVTKVEKSDKSPPKKFLDVSRFILASGMMSQNLSDLTKTIHDQLGFLQKRLMSRGIPTKYR